MTEVRWERMFPDQLEAALAACPVVYFAYGLCEPHGPHNAIGLDALKAHGLCCRAARDHGGIVAPPDYWHVHEVAGYACWGAANIGEARAWLTAVPPEVHFRNVCYHVRAADALGFEAALLVTGHYGPNWQDLRALLDILQPHVAMRLYGLPDFEANVPGFSEDGPDRDHGGKVETSQLWAMEPQCVDLSRLPAEDAPPPHYAMGETARQADRRIGERMVADQAAWLGTRARELLADYRATAPPQRQPLSFRDIEHIWTQEVLPILPQFKSLQQGNRTPPPPDSTWRLNYDPPK